MNTIIELWYVWVTILAIGIVAGYNINKFLQMPTDEQIKCIKNWLVRACIEAEKALGSGTGRMKALMVYDWFVAKFPAVANIVSFDTFMSWLELALEEAKHLMETNERISTYVNNGE